MAAAFRTGTTEPKDPPRWGMQDLFGHIYGDTLVPVSDRPDPRGPEAAA